MQNLIKAVLKKDLRNKYFSFSNKDGKHWILPEQNILTAFNLYQPSGLKGKLLKCLFPYLKSLKIVQKAIGAQLDSYALQDNLKALLEKVFNIQQLEIAIFGGTPSNHQKITIQIFQGSQILGYCKLSDNADVKEIFRHEQQILDNLKQKGVSQIPECLFCGALSSDIDVFVQTTVKTNRSKTVHSWKSKHWLFLKDVKEKTEVQIIFEQSDFYDSLQLLEQNRSYLAKGDSQLIEKTIVRVKNYYKAKEVGFSAYHADFTPWNMFTENRELFFFDFEYAKMTYPPYLDRFHFLTQVCIFEKCWGVDRIYSEYQKEKTNLDIYINNPDFSYLCYLLDIVSLYVNRDKGCYSKDVANNLSIWISLISRLVNEQE